MYTVTQGTFRTPKGRSVTLAYREDTNDYNTLRSCLDEDEYRLAELDLTGTALDIGAHIGGVTIALLLDNPALKVVAVEALPHNDVLLRGNLQRNGVSDRVTVLCLAAGDGQTTTIRWNFTGGVGQHHAFIGNAVMPDPTDSVAEVVEGISLSDLTAEHGPFSFMKIDCEGCEHTVLADPAASLIPLIRGELHYPSGVQPLEIVR